MNPITLGAKVAEFIHPPIYGSTTKSVLQTAQTYASAPAAPPAPAPDSFGSSLGRSLGEGLARPLGVALAVLLVAFIVIEFAPALIAGMLSRGR